MAVLLVFVLMMCGDGVVVLLCVVEAGLGLELLDGGVGLACSFEGLLDHLDVLGGGGVDVGAELSDLVEEVGVGVLENLDGALAFVGYGLDCLGVGGGLGAFLGFGLRRKEHLTPSGDEPIEVDFGKIYRNFL